MRIVIILVILALIGGAVFYGYSQNQKKLRIEAEALAQEIKLAETSAADVAAALEGLEESSPQVWELMATASNMVPDIVGTEYAPRVYDPDYDKKKASEKWKKTLEEMKKKPAPSDKAPAPGAKVGVVVDEFGREAPAGLSVRGAPEKKEVLPSKTDDKPSSSAEIEGVSDPKLAKRIKDAQRYIQELREHCESVEARLDEAFLIGGESKKILGQVRESVTSFRAKEAQAGFKDLLPMAKGLRKSIEAEVAEAKAVLPKLKAMKAEVDAEKQAAADAAQRQREAEERAARKKRELSMAAGWYEGKAALIKKYKFAEAAEEIEDLQSSFTFEEAKTQLDTPLMRYKLVASLRKWLISEFKKKPMPWGWRTPGGGLDIETADEQGIYVQEKLIPWTDVSPKRMISFFSHYLQRSEDVGKSKADLYIGAAIFARMADDEDAEEYYLEKAEVESEVAAREIPKLMGIKEDEGILEE